jgi:hypothetical protein
MSICQARRRPTATPAPSNAAGRSVSAVCARGFDGFMGFFAYACALSAVAAADVQWLTLGDRNPLNPLHPLFRGRRDPLPRGLRRAFADVRRHRSSAAERCGSDLGSGCAIFHASAGEAASWDPERGPKPNPGRLDACWRRARLPPCLTGRPIGGPVCY